jgi:hypothetical protein
MVQEATDGEPVYLDLADALELQLAEWIVGLSSRDESGAVRRARP